MRLTRLAVRFAIVALALFLWMTGQASATRLKDISSIEGVRANQLIGYGLVVGLRGSGDKSYKSPFTIQTLLSMLERLGTTVDVQQLVNPRIGISDVRWLRDVRVENIAAVMVTAELPAFAQQGTRIDVTASSLGDARSLQGGTLLLTPLKAANGEIYAVAQGAVSVGGGFSERLRRLKYVKNHPTVARISNGAMVEKEVGFDFSTVTKLSFALFQPDFTTSQRVVEAINGELGGESAKAVNSGVIEISVPDEFADKKVELVSRLENLEVEPDMAAKVVMDERTGTIVVGEQVRISKVAISHGNLTIRIASKTSVSQPPPLSAGQTVVIPGSILSVGETGGKTDRLMVLDPGVSIGEMVKALNAIGVKPRDLIAIFQTLKAAGALKAQLEIM
ncbi:MAG TPA: flagellar basal body P-ring protein FlgI [Nitrospirae bacterium]|nr:flagellar basal body P-ring protein FlgI [Nitrospirota bacterium]